MKLVLLCMLSFSTFANQFVGDFSEHEYFYAGNFIGTSKNEVIMQLPNNNFSVRELMKNPSGQIVSDLTEERRAGELVGRSLVGQIIIECTNIAGQLEQITMNSRTFMTCKLGLKNLFVQNMLPRLVLESDQNGHIWVGEVAIDGIVKLTTPDYELRYLNTNW